MVKEVDKNRDKLINKCEHTDKPYYAKGFCVSCYHAKGRTNLSTKCQHKDRPAYAFSMCKNCYLSKYHKVRREKIKQIKKNEEMSVT